MPEKNGYAAIWDMDGTLVDTAELHFEAWAATARERDRPFSRDDFANTFGRRNPEIIHILFGEALTGEEAHDLAERKELLYRDAAGQGVVLLPGVRALLEDLDRAGFVQAIGSSAPRANLELILRLTGVERFFPAVVAMEDTQRGKPDPQVFQLAAQRLGIPPERCVVLEDAVAGVQAARAGGMKCIAIRFVGHHSEDALREAGADFVAPTLEQLSAETVRRLFQVAVN
jgi:beta-phosphoglucomutase